MKKNSVNILPNISFGVSQKKTSHRFLFGLRGLNNDKMFISGHTVPLTLSLGNIFSLSTVRYRERLVFFSFFPSWLSLVRPLCVRSTHYLNVNYSAFFLACVSPSNPAGFETVPVAILAHLAPPLTVPRPSKSLIGPLPLSITGNE